MFRLFFLCLLLPFVLVSCCPPATLEGWSSSAPVLAGNWQFQVLTVNPISFECDTDGAPVGVGVLRSLSGGEQVVAQIITDRQLRPVDDPNLSDIVCYMARGRATKSGDPNASAANDNVVIEFEIYYYVLDLVSLGICPQHVGTVEITFSGTFDDTGRASGTGVIRNVPAEAALRVSPALASHISQTVPLQPSVGIWSSVLMHRPQS